jgi:hypothetical protein
VFHDVGEIAGVEGMTVIHTPVLEHRTEKWIRFSGHTMLLF